VRRLCIDWRRHRDGRFRLPRAIARLPDLEQEVFRCVHLRGLSENETFHTLKALRPALTREQLAGAASRVAGNLTSRQSWLLLVRRPRLQSLSAAPAEADPVQAEAGLVDPRPDPERDALVHESLLALKDAIGLLPPRERLLVRLRYGQELPLEEIARLTGLSGAGQVERQIQKALGALRDRMGAQGFAGLSVKEK
jgi:RNA polymerase sigma factor (sigma-70 family)